MAHLTLTGSRFRLEIPMLMDRRFRVEILIPTLTDVVVPTVRQRPTPAKNYKLEAENG